MLVQSFPKNPEEEKKSTLNTFFNEKKKKHDWWKCKQMHTYVCIIVITYK